jgi:6-phosphogluconate dehydrogenase
MQIAIAGLGRMGMNMAVRLLQGGHEVIAHNRSPQKVEEAARIGAAPAYTLAEAVNGISAPRALWLMLPAGKPVEDTIDELKTLLSPGDIILDGGNSYYKDDYKRFAQLEEVGLNYLDVGVSGGVWGLKEGYCLMIGGKREVYERLEPIFRTLAPPDGYMYCGAPGAGHFVKMVHNGIEYGMMQAYAEGFDLIQASPFAEGLDYSKLSHLWNQGSVIRSWLLELLESAFSDDPRLDRIRGYVDDSGEGRWTVQEAVDMGVAAPVAAMSLFMRFRSREDDAFSNRVLAALRREFGGHGVKDSK